MATETIFIYDLRAQRLDASINVVVLANSYGVTDAGQFVIYEQEVSATSKDSRAALGSVAILMSKDNSCLTIGGDYHGESSNSAYNIYVNSAVLKDSPRIIGTDTAATISAVHFTQNGTLVLASQAGNVNADQDVYDEGKTKSDDNMKIAASRSIATSSEVWNTAAYGALPTEANVYTFLADAKLTVNSSLVGTITASNTIDFKGGYSVGSDGKITYVDNVSNTKLNSIVFKAKSLDLEGNIEKALSATMTATLETVAAPKAESNTITAAVFVAETEEDADADADAGSFLMENGLWAGSATASANNIEIDALYKELMGTSGTAASAGGNAITAKVVDAEAIQICEIGSGEELNAGVLKAQVKDVTIEAKSSSDTADVSTSVSNNLIEAVVFDGSTIQIDCLNADANLTAELSNIRLEASHEGGKTYTENMIGNTISAVAIRGDEVTIGDLYGSINVSTEGLKLQGEGGSYNLASYNNKTTVAGISATTLTVNGKMTGRIDVSSDSYIGAYTDYTLAGIVVDETMTVSGSVDTDITMSGEYALKAGTLEATAFTGTITGASTGIQLGLLSSTDGDAFDMAGTITATTGLIVDGRTNLRVSGSITSSIASVKTGSGHDTLELSSTACVSGSVDLGRGSNTLVMNSNAQLDGSMLASEGTLQVKFILDGEQTGDRAVVEAAGATDFTLNSGSELIVDLNYATDGEIYKLIHYAEDADADRYWTGTAANHQISFLYHGKKITKTLTSASEDNTVLIEFDNGEEGMTTAALRYVKEIDTVIVENISGVSQRQQFAAIKAEETKYDADARTATICWDTAKTYGLTAAAYELEYTVFEKDGDDWVECGESILVRISDVKQSSYVIGNLDSDQKVEYRMRLVGKGDTDDPTAWSEVQTIAGSEATPAEASGPSFKDGAVTSAVNTTDSNLSRMAITTISWDAPESERPMDYYVLEVYETDELIVLTQDELEDEDGMTYQQKILNVLDEQSGKENVYTKTVTSTEAVISGLHSNYLYWRVKGVDVDGNETCWGTEEDNAWLPGASIEATGKPTFEEGESSVTLESAGKEGYNVSITIPRATDSTCDIYKYVLEIIDSSLKDSLLKDSLLNDSLLNDSLLNDSLLNDSLLKDSSSVWETYPDKIKTYIVKEDSISEDGTVIFEKGSIEVLEYGEYIYRYKAVNELGTESEYIQDDDNQVFGDGTAPLFDEEKLKLESSTPPW